MKLNIDKLAVVVSQNGFFEKEHTLDHYFFKEAAGDRTILVINDHNMNIRNASQGLNVAMQLAEKYHCDSNKAYLIVVGRKGGLHRYLNGRVIFFNYDSQRIVFKKQDKEIVKLTKELRKKAKLAAINTEIREQSKPEYISYSFAPLYILMSAIILMHFVTKSSYERWGAGPSMLYTSQSYRLITYMFTHGDLKHLIGNMVGLLIFGRIYTKAEGNMSLYSVFFGGGIFASLISSLYHIATNTAPDLLTVGASSGVFAVCGALLLETFVHPDFERNAVKIWLLIVLNLAVSNIGSNVDQVGHISGLAMGFIIGYIVKVFSLYEKHERIKKLNEKKDTLTKRVNCI